MRSKLLGLTVGLGLSVFSASAQQGDRLLEFYQSQKYVEGAAYLAQEFPGTTDLTRLSQLGYFNLMAGDLAASEKYYSQANQLYPQSVSVLMNLARLALRRGVRANAQQYYEEVLKVDSANAQVYILLADVVSDSDIKIKYLKKAYTLNPKNADVTLDLAERLFDRKNFDESYTLIRRGMASDTSNYEFLKLHLMVASQLEKFEEGIASGVRLVRAGEHNVRLLNMLGRMYYNTKKFKEAIATYLSVPDDYRTENTYYYLTLCYRQLLDYPTAIAYANKTIDAGISPNTAGYYALKGALLEGHKQPQSALTAYRRGLIYKDHTDIYYNMGLLYDKLGNKKQALTNYQQFLRSKPDVIKNKGEIAFVAERLVELKK